MLSEPKTFQQGVEQCIMRFVQAYVISYSEIPCGLCEIAIVKFPRDNKCDYCKRLKLWPIPKKNKDIMRSYNNKCITYMNTKAKAPLRVNSLRISTNDVWIDFKVGKNEINAVTAVISLGSDGMHVKTNVVRDRDYVMKMFEVIIKRCFEFLEEIKNWIEENDEDSLSEFDEDMMTLGLLIYRYERLLPQQIFFNTTIFDHRGARKWR